MNDGWLSGYDVMYQKVTMENMIQDYIRLMINPVFYYNPQPTKYGKSIPETIRECSEMTVGAVK